jgi:hypothetical protein
MRGLEDWNFTKAALCVAMFGDRHSGRKVAAYDVLNGSGHFDSRFANRN